MKIKCLYDETMNLPFDALDEKHKVCYRYTENAPSDALTVEGVGSFIPAPYAKEEYNAIMRACNKWQIVIRSTCGFDANSDNGIQSVSTSVEYRNVYPEHCLCKDDKVIGFVDEENRYFIIGEKSDRWTVDLTTYSTGPYGEDEVDITRYLLGERKK